ncbi:S8/S53 family peptidase [Halpernia frigidisoli]|uniref:Por secretion system C-terminal sorting domain-containing protein n=1 Tax=Halpernia frigidisoli TaxID=1125876 RepID=A0A1I3E2C0_9FLAO|nr:S8/S53 family peptidase [Halpernia frigidisoli]SFH93033.1 Por secretion system C-terminal sorting domain-containing protein [Halpernia frigidisoli]
MKKILFLLSFIFIILDNAQTELVFVYFKDKPNSAAFYSNQTSELTQKSLDRRTKFGIALTDEDAPIEAVYIQNIKNLGFTVTDYSKWLNGVAVEANAAQVADLRTKSYVRSVESFVVHNSTVNKTNASIPNKFEEFNKNTLTNFNYGNAAAQIDQVNLRPVHVAGFTGAGTTIAVIDTGFPTVNTGSVYSRIRNNGQIKGGYNFVQKNADIYNTNLNSHGSYCLGVIAAFVDNSFVGTAPDADFYLYASENAAVEIPQEQLYWIEAAEEADRKGVDIISTSLGYNIFDDSRYNLVYADLDGKTSFIARGAEIATKKGIFVLVANGNSATEPWHYLLTPADNNKVFSIGSVDLNGNSSSFSSFGPNAIGNIKPDASARGVNTYMGFNNSVTSANGTSFATPLAAGGVACLIQSTPGKNPALLSDLLRQSASLYPNSDPQKGYGILNFGSVLTKLLSSVEVQNSKNLKIFPNPVTDILHFQTKEKIINIELYDSLGRKIKNLEIAADINVSNLNSGVYYLKINTEKENYIEKFIKK